MAMGYCDDLAIMDHCHSGHISYDGEEHWDYDDSLGFGGAQQHRSSAMALCPCVLLLHCLSDWCDGYAALSMDHTEELDIALATAHALWQPQLQNYPVALRVALSSPTALYSYFLCGGADDLQDRY